VGGDCSAPQVGPPSLLTWLPLVLIMATISVILEVLRRNLVSALCIRGRSCANQGSLRSSSTCALQSKIMSP
jgi:hypothetical protein